MVNTLIKVKAAILRIAGHKDDLLNAPLPDELNGIIMNDTGHMIFYIEEQIFGYVAEADRRSYVTDIQFHLTELTDQISVVLRDPTRHGVFSDLFYSMSEKAVSILDHLYTHFLAYFNLNGKLPSGYTSQPPLSDNERVQGIISELQAMEIDPDLITILSGYLLPQGSSDLYPLQTWQQWQYLQETINWLEQFTNVKPAVKAECKLLLELVSRNFNSIRLYAYFLKYIAQFTQSDRSFQDQQQDLLYLLKLLRQVLVDPQYAYDVQVQPLKKSLIDCLTAELEYCEQREKLFTDHYKSTVNTPSRFYFDIVVTLAELMFLIKISLEINFIRTKFRSYVYEFISNHIHTRRAENLSKKSMRNHISNSYLPDRSVQNVREWLSKMIAHIDLHYKS